MNLSKNQLKYIKSLHQSKFRQMYENFIGEGDKVVSELLKYKKFEIELIAAKQSWIDQNYILLHNYQNVLYCIDNEQMKVMTTLKTPSDVLIIAKKKVDVINNLLNPTFKAFYLDGLQDPGNVGTIIRIADWFGMDAVIRSNSTADFFHPKVVQSSMGSIAGIGLCNIEQHQLANLKNLAFYAMDMQGQEISNIDFTDQSIIILGNEGHGISPEIKSLGLNLQFVTISGHKHRVAESLNVGVSAGIVASKIFSA